MENTVRREEWECLDRKCARCGQSRLLEEFETRESAICFFCIPVPSGPTRACPTCFEEKTEDEFPTRRTRTCTDCKAESDAARRLKLKSSPRLVKADEERTPSRDNRAPARTTRSDRLDNTWDLGELSSREQNTYFRGLWVGWKRGIDSHSRVGAGDGNILATFLASVLARANIPLIEKAKIYRVARVLSEDFLPEHGEDTGLPAWEGLEAPPHRSPS